MASIQRLDYVIQTYVQHTSSKKIETRYKNILSEKVSGI